MILGTGFDITALARIRDAEERFGKRFLERVLTEGERQHLPREDATRTAYISGRWAAKEAAVKALGTGFDAGIGFHDVEILKSATGQPLLFFHGRAEQEAEARHVRHIHVSISHEREHAGAMVILED